MRYAIARGALIFWCLFVGLGAAWGASAMWMAPDGSILQMQSLLPYFQVLPFADALFQDYVFSGIALFLVNGAPNLLAAWLLLRRRPRGVALGMALGGTLMAWIAIQFVIFPRNPLSTAYFIFGALQLITGYACWVYTKQAELAGNHIPRAAVEGAKELVVYFSRLGYARKLACEIAAERSAALFEITTEERTAGTLGFWWCGRFGMHRWPMPIGELPREIAGYERVIIVSPIWVFGVCAPVRAFLGQCRGKIRAAEYVLVHFQGCAYKGVADEMDKILGLRRERFVSVCARLGKERKRRCFL